MDPDHRINGTLLIDKTREKHVRLAAHIHSMQELLAIRATPNEQKKHDSSYFSRKIS